PDGFLQYDGRVLVVLYFRRQPDSFLESPIKCFDSYSIDKAFAAVSHLKVLAFDNRFAETGQGWLTDFLELFVSVFSLREFRTCQLLDEACDFTDASFGFRDSALG